MRFEISPSWLSTAALAGCQHTATDLPDRGVAAINVPVLLDSEFVFDAAAPGGSATGDGAGSTRRLVRRPWP